MVPQLSAGPVAVISQRACGGAWAPTPHRGQGPSLSAAAYTRSSASCPPGSICRWLESTTSPDRRLGAVSDPSGAGQDRSSSPNFCYARCGRESRLPRRTRKQTDREGDRQPGTRRSSELHCPRGWPPRCDDQGHQAYPVASVRRGSSAAAHHLCECRRTACWRARWRAPAKPRYGWRSARACANWPVSISWKACWLGFPGRQAACCSVLRWSVCWLASGARSPHASRAIAMDWGVMGFAVATAFAACALASMAPLWQAARTLPNEVLSEGVRASAGARSGRLSRSFVVAEVALALRAAGRRNGPRHRALPRHARRSRLRSHPPADIPAQLLPPRAFRAGQASSLYETRLLDAVEAIPGVMGAA